MNRRDIVIGMIIVVALAGVIYWRRSKVDQEEIKLPQTLSVEDQIEEAFNIEIPEDVARAELKDVSGGDATGIATREFEGGTFDHSVLADLPEPESGKFYESWLVKENDTLSTGKLTLAKGGYMLNFQSNTDYSEYNGVVVTLEEKFDSTAEKHILEGSF